MSLNDRAHATIGFGTWGLDKEKCSVAVESALSSGFRHIDTAAAYLNEREVGLGVSAYLQAGGASRDSLFVSGKLWITQRPYDKVIRACKRSLKRMGLEYFDQYLIHWPASQATDEHWKEVNAETWRAMESLHADGIARSIGVCNFLSHHLEPLLSCATIPPAVNQLEIHPGKGQFDAIDYCNAQSISVEAWSPLAQGLLLKHPTVLEIALRNELTPAQVCLCWCLAHSTMPIVRSQSKEHMEEALAVSNIRLSSRDIELLDRIPPYGDSGMDPDKLNNFN